MITKETVVAINKYEEQRKQVRKVLRMKKRKYWADKMKEIEDNLKNWEIRDLYMGVKNEKDDTNVNQYITKIKREKPLVVNMKLYQCREITLKSC